MGKIFYRQILYLLATTILLITIGIFVTYSRDSMMALCGESVLLFWLATAVPVIHQSYVWLIWRLELFYSLFTSRLGLQKVITMYAIGFSILFVSRLISITAVALSDQYSLAVHPLLAYLTAAVILPVVMYLFYSVKRYFTIERSYGIDHFDKNYNEPYVKKGISRIQTTVSMSMTL